MRTAEDLPDARVDDLRSILGGGPPPPPRKRAGASVQLSVLRGGGGGQSHDGPSRPMPVPELLDADEVLDQESAHGLDLAADAAPTVFVPRLPDLEPTAMISGRKRVQIDRDWAETPTVSGVRLGPARLDDPHTDVQVARDAFGLRGLPVSQDPLPPIDPSQAVAAPDRLQWGFFLAASAVGCLALWALVFVR